MILCMRRFKACGPQYRRAADLGKQVRATVQAREYSFPAEREDG
jgi:hypothetical protein